MGNTKSKVHSEESLKTTVSRKNEWLEQCKHLEAKLNVLEANWNEKEQRMTEYQKGVEKVKENLEFIAKNVKEIKEEWLEPTFMCRNTRCNSLLPNSLPLLEDGVTVECPNPKCTYYNVVGKLEEGQKWMRSCRCRGHYQQMPIGTKRNLKGVCNVCGKENTVFDDGDMYLALRY